MTDHVKGTAMKTIETVVPTLDTPHLVRLFKDLHVTISHADAFNAADHSALDAVVAELRNRRVLD